MTKMFDTSNQARYYLSELPTFQSEDVTVVALAQKDSLDLESLRLSNFHCLLHLLYTRQRRKQAKCYFEDSSIKHFSHAVEIACVHDFAIVVTSGGAKIVMTFQRSQQALARGWLTRMPKRMK